MAWISSYIFGNIQMSIWSAILRFLFCASLCPFENFPWYCHFLCSPHVPYLFRIDQVLKNIFSSLLTLKVFNPFVFLCMIVIKLLICIQKSKFITNQYTILQYFNYLASIFYTIHETYINFYLFLSHQSIITIILSHCLKFLMFKNFFAHHSIGISDLLYVFSFL